MRLEPHLRQMVKKMLNNNLLLKLKVNQKKMQFKAETFQSISN